MNKPIQEKFIEGDSLTAGFEDPDMDPEQMMDQIHLMFGVGHERKEVLDKLMAVDHSRDGNYLIQYANNGDYADFIKQANYNYLKKEYPFLYSIGQNLGFDEDQAADDNESFENYLAQIPEDNWEAFVEDMHKLDNYPLLDEDGATDLEQKESERWLDEEGSPHFIKAMVADQDDGYKGYQLSKVSTYLVWYWCRETGHYPENQGDGTVYMNMDRFAVMPETQEWFLERIPDDFDGWIAVKRKCFDDQAGVLFDNLLKSMADSDPQTADTYHRLDSLDQVFEIFLEAFPDDRRNVDDPYWYPWKRAYDEPIFWKVGYEDRDRTAMVKDWKGGYREALEYLPQQEWFHKLLVNWFRRGQKDHPEFKSEHLQESEDELSSEEISSYIQHGSGIQEEIVYQDDKIVVFFPHNLVALDYHFQRLGFPPISEQFYRGYFKYRDIFVILGKGDPQRELGIIYGDESGLQVWVGNTSKNSSIDSLLDDPAYGKSIRRCLLKFYRNDKKDAGNLLLKLGGPLELRRAAHKGIMDLDDHGVAMGFYYVSKHKYKLAAKAFNRSVSTITPKGVWLRYNDVSDLAPIFENEDAATAVLSNENWDWFDHYYETRNLPDVKDVIPFFNSKAIAKIRSVLVNRKVWFPDAGENRRGDYVTLTKEMLVQFDDKTILGWISDLSDEDAEDGVFDDIIDAIKKDGASILAGASQDTLYQAYIQAAVDQLDGSEQKWVDNPAKKGSSMFTFFVPWASVQERAELYQLDAGAAYTTGKYGGSLEQLAIEANKEKVTVDQSRHEASWSDVNKEYASDSLNDIYELEAPEPPPGSPNYKDPNHLTLPLSEGLLMEGYDYSTTQVDLPHGMADFIIEWGQFNIPDDSLYLDPKDNTKGREKDIHITVLYGILSQDIPPELKEITKQVSPFPVLLGKISLFDTNPDYDVVKIDVESPVLRALNSRMSTEIENENSHTSYLPHVTVAYVQKGSCDKLVGQDPFKAKDVAREFTASGLVFKGSGDDDDPNRSHETLLFSKINKPASEVVAEHGSGIPDPFADCGFPADSDRIGQFLLNRHRRSQQRTVL